MDTPELRRSMPTTVAYAITARLHCEPSTSVIGRVATAVVAVGGLVTAIDIAESRPDRMTVDVSCSARDSAHAEELVAALRNVPGATVHRVSDRTFLLHLAGRSPWSPRSR